MKALAKLQADHRARARAAERLLVLDALQVERGNAAAAARRLGIARCTIDAKVRALGLADLLERLRAEERGAS